MGTIGFSADALVLLLLIEKFLLSIELSRFCSFLFAVFVTWFLNRIYTFQASKYSKKKEYIYYLLVQTIGAFLNYSIFIFLAKKFLFFEKNIIFALAVASLFAMFFNFFTLKKKLFTQTK